MVSVISAMADCFLFIPIVLSASQSLGMLCSWKAKTEPVFACAVGPSGVAEGFVRFRNPTGRPHH
jgi:hypothetical protein